MKINLYTLTEEEIEFINSFNVGRTNTIMVVCSHGEHSGLDADDLQKPEFSEYLNLLGVFNSQKVIEVDVE
jgi:hypothetical protein